jgi:hypothetical protein
MSRIVSFPSHDAALRSASVSPSKAAREICAKVLELDDLEPRALTAFGLVLDRYIAARRRRPWPRRALQLFENTPR